jgi:hypothetical protein
MIFEYNKFWAYHIFEAFMKRLLILIILTLSHYYLSAQDNEADKFLIVHKINEKIFMDGILDEEVWSRDNYADDFWQFFPSDTTYAEKQTEIHMAFDEDNLYVAIKCYSSGKNYIIPSLKRDFRGGGNDFISLMIDPFNDNTNAFMFGTNPYGVQREGLISNGGTGSNGFSTSWENKWKCESRIYDDYWTSEMIIPFRTLRFDPESTHWSFNCYRFDTQDNERSTWMRIPRNHNIFTLAYMGKMKWDHAPKKSGSNISIIPFSSANVTKDFEEQSPTSKNFSLGGDAKVAITSSMNLDMTFNPDFSQVEVDRQITNLDRFEIFFPERRQFFLENADLFSSFGEGRINPFFSRRIGVALDTTSGSNIQNTIYAGAKLSGKINGKTRVGLLTMQTADDDENGLPSYNYSVVSIQRNVFGRSNIGLFVVNKQSIGEVKDEIADAYNRVIGIDYNLATESNIWSGKTFFHKAFTLDKELVNKFSHGLRLEYSKRSYNLIWRHSYVGEGFDAQVGFVPRKDFVRINPRVEFSFYPEDGIFNKPELNFDAEFYFKPGFGKTDHSFSINWGGELKNTQRIGAEINHEFIYLFEEFDPTRTDAVPLPAESSYSFITARVNFRSDERKKLIYRINPFGGQYFNGYRYGVSGSFLYRFVPFGSVSVDYTYNYINLPEPYHSTSLYLVGPKIDLTFSKSIFLSAFVQYNSQLENTNINTRFQWRFAPASDFFLVYTDNYFTGNNDFGDFQIDVRNRAVVAKITYWINL